MAQLHSPLRYAAVSLALVDNLLTALTEKGILSPDDRAKVLGGAFHGLRTASNDDVRDAALLMETLYPQLSA